jgi:hypothetical protein
MNPRRKTKNDNSSPRHVDYSSIVRIVALLHDTGCPPGDESFPEIAEEVCQLLDLPEDELKLELASRAREVLGLAWKDGSQKERRSAPN